MATRKVIASLLVLPLPVASFEPPEGCPLPAPWVVTSFNWFNGSHSLDCIHSEVDKDTKGCFASNTSPPYWYDLNEADCAKAGGHWINICWTGLNYQPPGYGPPHELIVDFEGGLRCYTTYIGYRNRDIGNDAMSCGYADFGMGRVIGLYGNTNTAHPQTRMEYTLGNDLADRHALQCANGSRILYSGAVDVPLTCVHDAGFNATCTTPRFEVPILEYQLLPPKKEGE